VGIALGRDGLAGAVSVLFLEGGTFPPERAGEEVGMAVTVDVAKGRPLGVDALVEDEAGVGGIVGNAGRDEKKGNGERGEEGEWLHGMGFSY
jgi:hypothetical protein